MALAKGRVERAIQYIRRSFFAALRWKDLDDLNEKALAWCEGLAFDRPWPEDRKRTVREAFSEEKEHLLPLPGNPFPTEERTEVRIGKTPYARFDGNDYSVPHDRVRRTLVVLATLRRLRILDGAEVVAEHERSFSRGDQIENPSHLAALAEEKRRARKHRSFFRLHEAAPSSKGFFVELAKRGERLESATRSLLGFLEEYGAASLERALREVLENGVPHVPAVRQILEQERRERGERPKTKVELPDDPRLTDLYVKPHELGLYDEIAEQDPATEEQDDDVSV